MRPVNLSIPTRQIHLDFHTGPSISDVGVHFDAIEFARVMKAAHVNSVTVFAKCHHGHLYYDTKHPARHPGLRRELNLLGEQVEALHREGIRAPIYISVQCDEYAANIHPEWIALRLDSSQVRHAGRGPFEADWQILDMSSGYRDYLREQTLEILRLFKPVDGIFFDMCWDQSSSSRAAIKGVTARGMNPALVADCARYAHVIALDYMREFFALVRDHSPSATVHFNSRPLWNLAEEIDCAAQVEIEALPTGGWGYMYFPNHVRFARTFGLPYLGMTARFHKSWADFGGLKPYAALEYETSQMIAHGAACSIGDQMHPRGTLDAAAYDLIGKVYHRVVEREPWILGATAVTDIGLFRTAREGYAMASGTDEGAVRVLTQLRQQFDIVHDESDFSHFRVLILPEGTPVSPALAGSLRAFVQAGGSLLVCGNAGVSSDGTASVLGDLLPVILEGESPFTAHYVMFNPMLVSEVPATRHVIYERALRARAKPDALSLAAVSDPYFERAWDHFCSHNQTPDAAVTPYTAAALFGHVGYIASPLFGMVSRHGNASCRWLLKAMLDRLLPEPLLHVSGPTGLESTVMRVGDARVVHLLYYASERRAMGLDLIEDVIPLFDIEIDLHADAAPQRVEIVPERQQLPFSYDAGRVRFTLPRLDGHAMIVVGE